MAHLAISVPFHGSTIYIIEYRGKPYIPMKPIVDGMGIDWMRQLTKLRQRFSSTIEEIPVVTDCGKHEKIVCLPLRKLVGWLQTISPNKVKPEVRANVVQFQNECDDVLYDYWTKGKVQQQSLPEPLNATDMSNLKWLINMMGARFKHKEAWNAGIWYSLRLATNTPSPQPFKVEDLPTLVQECRRVMDVTSEASNMICQFEKDVLKHVIRNRKDFEIIASKMQNDFQQLELQAEGTRALKKFEEFGLKRLEKRIS